MKDDVPNLKDYSQRLRDEANMDIADIQAEGEKEAPTKHTQIIAIYGKGGIGKSFTLANPVSYTHLTLPTSIQV